MSMNAFETGMTGHHDQSWNYENFDMFFGELTGEQLDRCVRQNNGNRLLAQVCSMRENPSDGSQK